MCSIFQPTDHKHVQAALKFQSPYFDWETDPILQFFPQKHTYKVIFLRHLGTLLLFIHTAISIHEHNHITTQTPQVYASVRTYLMSSLSFLFSLLLFLPMSLSIIFSGQKQPCILHLLLFPMKQQHCLYPVCHRPLPPLISAVSPLSHTLLLMCSDACQVRCSSGKPTPVTLHSHCFQTYMYMYHSSHAHHKIPNLFQSHTDMFMKTTQVFRLATNHTTQFTLIKIK